MISPPLISTGVFVMVIRMLAIMCASCPDLAVLLLKQSESIFLSFIIMRTFFKKKFITSASNVCWFYRKVQKPKSKCLVMKFKVYDAEKEGCISFSKHNLTLSVNNDWKLLEFFFFLTKISSFQNTCQMTPIVHVTSAV